MAYEVQLVASIGVPQVRADSKEDLTDEMVPALKDMFVNFLDKQIVQATSVQHSKDPANKVEPAWLEWTIGTSADSSCFDRLAEIVDCRESASEKKVAASAQGISQMIKWALPHLVWGTL